MRRPELRQQDAADRRGGARTTVYEQIRESRGCGYAREHTVLRR